MNKPPSHTRASRFAALLLLGLTACTGPGPGTAPVPIARSHLGTKAPYAPQQDWRLYQPVPDGYAPLHVQLVARHGSRGISSPGDELALVTLWRQADAADGLTPLGRALGPALLDIVRVNALLGAGRPGVRRPGYGNLSLQGLREHRGLARRLVERSPAWAAARSVQASGSGVDRAMESGRAFLDELAQAAPALAGQLPDGIRTDRARLYFHRLGEADRLADPTPAGAAAWDASQRYQAYRRSAGVAAAIERVRLSPEVGAAARAVIGRVFTPAYAARVAAGEVSARAATDLEFASADGRHRAQPRAGKKVELRGAVDVALALFEVAVIRAGLRDELTPTGAGAADIDAVFPPGDAARLAWVLDAEDYYEKGPGIREDAPATYAIADGLLRDFLDAVGAAAALPRPPGMTLRFTHAEILIPFVARLGIQPHFDPVPRAGLYRYETNRWRSAEVSPMAANVQWESFRNDVGQVLVRVLHNEREVALDPACDGARWRPASVFYRLEGLAACLRSDAPAPAGGARR